MGHVGKVGCTDIDGIACFMIPFVMCSLLRLTREVSTSRENTNQESLDARFVFIDDWKSKDTRNLLNFSGLKFSVLVFLGFIRFFCPFV